MSRLAIVGGCGRVGLPLAMTFADRGFEVTAIDTDETRVALVKQGKMPFHEQGGDALLPRLMKAGRLRVTTDQDAVKDVEVVVVTIGTPINLYLDPAVDKFFQAVHPVLARMHRGQLLILRSTVYPGVTGYLAQQLQREDRAGIDLAFCPERIAEDVSLIELPKLPQLIGGVTPRAAERAADVFRRLSPKVIFLTPVEAELSKLFCNTFRYINFACANQFYLVSQRFHASFPRLVRAMCEDYPRMKGFPLPGLAAGPCLYKDAMQLEGFEHDSDLLGHVAMIVNEGMPFKIVQEARQHYPLDRMTVGVLGMAFKTNSDDPRDSLSYKLRNLLKLECERVLCTDPYVPDPELVPLAEVLEQADLLIIGTLHDCYRGLRFRQPVIDLTGTLDGSQDGLPYARPLGEETTEWNGTLVVSQDGLPCARSLGEETTEQIPICA